MRASNARAARIRARVAGLEAPEINVRRGKLGIAGLAERRRGALHAQKHHIGHLTHAKLGGMRALDAVVVVAHRRDVDGNGAVRLGRIDDGLVVRRKSHAAIVVRDFAWYFTRPGNMVKHQIRA